MAMNKPLASRSHRIRWQCILCYGPRQICISKREHGNKMSLFFAKLCFVKEPCNLMTLRIAHITFMVSVDTLKLKTGRYG